MTFTSHETDLEIADMRVKRQFSPEAKRKIADLYRRKRAAGSTRPAPRWVLEIVHEMAMREHRS